MRHVYTKAANSEKQGRRKTLAEKDKIKSRWKECYEWLYNKQNPVDNTVLTELPTTNTAEDMEDFLEEEVAMAIKNLKKEKSPGEDNITAEMMQSGEDTVQQDLSGSTVSD